MVTRATDWISAQVVGQQWWYRLPVLLFMLWVLRGYLEFRGGGSIFSGINLGFHEMGHAAFMWSGNRILTTAGGTIFEIGVPIAAGAYLLVKQRDPFGAAFCLFWMGTALVGAGLYAADARAQALPLVSPFGPVDVDSHDWTVMLMKYGRLSKDQAIGGAMQAMGMWCMFVSVLLSAWVMRLMAVGTTTRGGARERTTASRKNPEGRRDWSDRPVPEEGLEPPTRGL